MQYVNNHLAPLLGSGDVFSAVDRLDGEIYRQVANRRTFRFECDGQGYFAKVHYGVGWGEIFKNLLQLRLPVVSARNEWLAIARLEALGISTMTLAACAERGWNPAAIRSCVVTEELADSESLEELVLRDGIRPLQRRQLLTRVARISRRLHENGVNHRDYYICHFLLRARDDALFLIDLHRVQLRHRTPRRWRVKDIGGLFYSAFDAGLTVRDLYRFMTLYTGRSLSETLREDRRFWRAVLRRASRLYRDEGREVPPWIAGLAP